MRGSTFRLNEPGSPEVTVTPDLLRGPRVTVDGRPVAREREGARFYWPIRMADGSERQLFVAGQLTGLRAIVDGTAYPVERPLEPWQVVLSVIPIGLVPILVGAFGILTGGIVAGLSFGLFREPWPAAARVAVWAVAVAAATAVGYLGAVSGILG